MRTPRTTTPRKPRSLAKQPKATPSESAETHQQASGDGAKLTTNQGVVISDNQNRLSQGSSGPSLLEDFILREKITHFDHERIPERVVHARGSAAHGYFELTRSLGDHTTARVLTEVGVRTPVFVRISTVAGGAGSVDTPRDVRGFAVKFYTVEGNWDLVGNNIPVFFIQDAMKFPDLVHALKMEPDRGYPQSASAHDTFWDFISLMPETIHMVMWAMSDRTLPRTLRMMEGFGVHSFRLVNSVGKSVFVKFHWRPVLGLGVMAWDEAVKTAGADPDFHRRDLHEAIVSGAFPEWTLEVQVFDEAKASSLPFDHLDPTKLIPEEVVPLMRIGRLVLDRNPDNFFAETEQVAFCPANVVPGIDFSDDPLLQGRLHSYLDTQLTRLGGPNFHQLPVNAPKCPFHNLQRDGMAQHAVPKGRVNYEPNSLDPAAPREHPSGFLSAQPIPNASTKERRRSPSFADHYSQARLFYSSLVEAEQRHLTAALTFELSKVQTPAIRRRMLAHLRTVDEAMADRVRIGLGWSQDDMPAPVQAAMPLISYPSSPALRTIGKYPPSLSGRCVGLLVDEGSNASAILAVRQAVVRAGATTKIVSPCIAGIRASDGQRIPADGQLEGTPSVFFDAIALILSTSSARRLAEVPAALSFVRDAFRHAKVIGVDAGGKVLFQASGLLPDAGVLSLDPATQFVAEAASRHWERETCAPRSCDPPGSDGDRPSSAPAGDE